MNKEEIEKAKEDLSIMNEGDYITREISNSKDILIKYIESLELINETWQVSNKIFREGTKELEQKEAILDKVTDKLKEDVREEEGYIKWLDERTQEISQPKKTIIVKSDYARSILDIIEGEKK